MKIQLNDPKVIVAYAVMPDGEKEPVTVVVREKQVTKIVYEVVVVGGLLGNGEESRQYDTIQQAMARAQTEADTAMLGD